MYRLINIEIKRNNLKPYNIAAAVSTVVMIGFLYLIAFIPQIEPTDSDAELFTSLKFVFGLTNVVAMGVFTILSAAMAAKFIVSEYGEKRAILLFSYPVERETVFFSKVAVVFGYTVITMIACSVVTFSIFILSDLIFKFNLQALNAGVVLNNIVSIVLNALTAACCGLLALWLGFIKKSVITTILSACVIVSLVCQVVAVAFFSSYLLYGICGTSVMLSSAAYLNMRQSIKKMEL